MVMRIQEDSAVNVESRVRQESGSAAADIRIQEDSAVSVENPGNNGSFILS